jgi:hypothetical protein
MAFIDFLKSFQISGFFLPQLRLRAFPRLSGLSPRKLSDSPIDMAENSWKKNIVFSQGSPPFSLTHIRL